MTTAPDHNQVLVTNSISDKPQLFDRRSIKLVKSALEEDIGQGDVTTEAIVESDRRAVALIIQKANGVIYGLDLVRVVFSTLDPNAQFEQLVQESEWNDSGTQIARISSTAHSLLTGERTALNFLAHLSGIATYTAQIVERVRRVNPTVKILDTRKTTPGLRLLEKAAVAAGGGTNHRIGLYDAVLIKENHIALAGGISKAITRVRSTVEPTTLIEVEVRNGAEIEDALSSRASRLLLDNMTPEEIAKAVAQVDGRAELEASGGITAENILEYAAIQGLNYISLGALTHSAKALDLSMIVQI